MNIFITGGTGFIGKYLLANLARREGDIYVLVREGSEEKLRRNCEQLHVDADRLVPVTGDLTQPLLGLGETDLERLQGNVDEFIHAGAIYDLTASAEAQHHANVEGTRQALALAEKLAVGCFNHISSIAVAGLYPGIFNEHMFEQGVDLDVNPYLRTKHDAEAVVREFTRLPWRVFRPSMVVGHSKTGEIDKIDGPYFMFKTLQKIRDVLPKWMVGLGVEGGEFNMVPVDYIADSIDHIVHQGGRHGDCFHLVDPRPYKMGDALSIFSEAAHGPKLALRIHADVLAFLPKPLREAVAKLPPVKHLTDQVLDTLQVPEQALKLLEMKTQFDDSNTQRALKGSGIAVPDLKDYAGTLWDYWERHLDPDLITSRSLEDRVQGKVVVVTGASSGIGKALALRLGECGAKVILVARGIEKLEETQQNILAAGGEAHLYPCDLSDLQSCDKLVRSVLRDHGQVDVLVNNAGRSIRRSLALTYDRFHDFERTMQLNYFGPLRLIMGLLPSMSERKTGHIVNVSSISVVAPAAPRFSAYVASKAALDHFSRAAGAEYREHNINFTNVHMPLVRTPMIGPTSVYRSVPALTPEEAVDLMEEAIVEQPLEVNTPMGSTLRVFGLIAPELSEMLMSTAYKVFPDSSAAKGGKVPEETVTTRQVALAAALSGTYL